MLHKAVAKNISDLQLFTPSRFTQTHPFILPSVKRFPSSSACVILSGSWVDRSSLWSPLCKVSIWLHFSRWPDLSKTWKVHEKWTVRTHWQWRMWGDAHRFMHKVRTAKKMGEKPKVVETVPIVSCIAEHIKLYYLCSCVWHLEKQQVKQQRILFVIYCLSVCSKNI